MGFGKTIKLFLIDGEPNGRLTCELSNWTGMAYKLPRTEVKRSTDRPNLNSTGVYMLFGRDEDDNEAVYIGEAEEVYTRLQNHLREKDFWNEVIVFISKDENLNKAHIKYIENKLYFQAKHANRYKVMNGNIPPMPVISEADRAEMDEFISNLTMIVPTLGHKVFEEIHDAVESTDDEYWMIQAADRGEARGILTQEGFVVMKGSTISSIVVDSYNEANHAKRDTLITSEKIKDQGGKLTFMEDVLFPSPSLAATIVLGRRSNGMEVWKNRVGQTIKDIS